MIRLEDVEFRYREGDFRLVIPSLAAEKGSSVAVVGPSGSGKTTLLRLVAGIVVPEAGRIVTDGVELTSLGDAQRRDFRIRNIGMVFQEFELVEHLSVLDNVLLPFRITRALTLDTAARARARDLAERVGIAADLGRLPGHLSQGERQRVAVCRALVTRPALLLADEPTGNLDPSNKGRVLEILLEFAAAEGATLLTVTHDHDLLDRFGRVVDFKAFATTASPAASPIGGAR